MAVGDGGRRADVDILKTVGCLFVIVYHLDMVRLDGPFSLWMRSLLSACVPIFLYATGVCIRKRTWALLGRW